MSKKPPYVPPTESETKKHWKSQEPSLFRQPPSSRKPDPGVTIANSRDEVLGIVATELREGPVPAFKLRSAAETLPDPMARTQGLIRASMTQTAEEFLQQCESVEDLILWNCRYGDMSDSQRNQGLVKLADLLFRKQQEVLKQLNIQKKDESQRQTNMLARVKAMKDDAAKKATAKGSDEG
uniref:Uncharacterized protein n=1 Tax=Caulobacter sp. (strain K31) TaxID=366602 RepID=B0T628_CAUSK